MAKGRAKIRRQHINNDNNRMLVIVLGAVVVFMVFACYILFLQKEILTSQTATLEQQYMQQNQQIQELQDQVHMMRVSPTGAMMRY